MVSFLKTQEPQHLFKMFIKRTNSQKQEEFAKKKYH